MTCSWIWYDLVILGKHVYKSQKKICEIRKVRVGFSRLASTLRFAAQGRKATPFAQETLCEDLVGDGFSHCAFGRLGGPGGVPNHPPVLKMGNQWLQNVSHTCMLINMDIYI